MSNVTEFFNNDFYLKYNKVIKVIDSCTNTEQLKTAAKMFDNFYLLVYRKFARNHDFWETESFDDRLEVFSLELKNKIKEKEKMFDLYKIENETCGAKLRNKLTPYAVLLDLVNSYKTGKFTSSEFLKVLNNEYAYNNLEDLKEFSKYLDNFSYVEKEF